MAVQTEEKLATHDQSHALPSDAHLHYPEIDEISERQEGMRIAREALTHNFLRYGGQSAIVLALVGVVAALGFWGVSQLHFLPGLFSEIARPFLPAPKAPVAVSTPKSGEGKSDIVDKPRIVQAPKHHHKARHKAPPPTYDYRRGGGQFSDNPTGGQIIYQDSMITEYHWNK